MASSFAITTTTAAGKLPAARRGHYQFTVTNTSGRTLTARPKVVPEPPGQESWFTVEGPAEQSLADGATAQVGVDVTVPAATPAGPLTFRLDVIGVENPDELTTKGPPVVVEVPAAPRAKPFPWWMVAAAAGILVVLAAGGGAGWYLTHQPVKVAATPKPSPSVPTPNPADPFDRFRGNWVNATNTPLGISRLQINRNSAGTPIGDLYAYCNWLKDPSCEYAIGTGVFDAKTNSVTFQWKVSGHETNARATVSDTPLLLVTVTADNSKFFPPQPYVLKPACPNRLACMDIKVKPIPPLAPPSP
jgi:hypothetical protein